MEYFFCTCKNFALFAPYVASWLVRSTPERAVQDSSTGRGHLTLVMPLSTQVYKLIRANLRTLALIVSEHPTAHVNSHATSCMSARAK